MIYPIANRTLFAFLRLFVRKVDGLNNVPKDKPVIMAANHDSYLDPLLICVVILPRTNRKIHWLAMKGRFWKYFGDRIARNWAGCVPLDEGKKKALNELTGFLKKGDNVGIFPGGPRSLNGSLTRGKTGVSRLVLGAKVPVIPVGLVGTYEIAPGERLIPKLKRADIKIGKPIYFNRYYNKKITKKILREIVGRVMKEIAKLANRGYEP
ncbi:1-acyl-sn-glycerol-3-phosphate acyltransferase [Candidatus Woesearchaeota archaeon]|nr:1-acyl-sn-glycerol-3-phosphate acyltransferase [Candidatus Woesearchaeota archaeon]